MSADIFSVDHRMQKKQWIPEPPVIVPQVRPMSCHLLGTIQSTEAVLWNLKERHFVHVNVNSCNMDMSSSSWSPSWSNHNMQWIQASRFMSSERYSCESMCADRHQSITKPITARTRPTSEPKSTVIKGIAERLSSIVGHTSPIVIDLN